MNYQKNISFTFILFFTFLLQAVTLAQASFQGLGYLPGEIFSSSTGVSADGSVVVGLGIEVAFRWTDLGGMIGLGDLPGGGFESRANGVSPDGSVVVGFSVSANGGEAFRWTDLGRYDWLG